MSGHKHGIAAELYPNARSLPVSLAGAAEGNPPPETARNGRNTKKIPPPIPFRDRGGKSIDKRKKAATYSPARGSTIGAGGLNFSVRNGKRWNPAAIATENNL